MPFQGDVFVRNQNFIRDRDLGPPDSTIEAERVDDEMDNIGAALSALKAALSALIADEEAGTNDSYTKDEADLRFVKAASALADIGALAKAGDKTTGALTLGGKNAATKGVVTGGTTVFDYVDGNVQSITINGPVTFSFANLPEVGGALQINFSIVSGSITVSGATWWEQGYGEKSTVFADIGVNLMAGRPYRMVIEMVAGYRTGILQ